MTEVKLLVPDGVPDAFRDRRDVHAAVVHEHHVDVALRAELRSPVPADRHQGDAGRRRPSGVLQELGEPLVDQIAVGTTPPAPGERLVGEQRTAFEAHAPMLRARTRRTAGRRPPVTSS